MAKADGRPPAFLLYVNDFCSDGIVEAMTTEEVGAYFLLLCKAWMEEQVGTVPDDDRVLARWSRLTPSRWSKCKTQVMAAFKLQSDGRWHQKRMKKEYAAYLAAQKEKSERAKKASAARWGDAHALQPHVLSNAKAMLKNAISYSLSSSSSISTDDDGDGARDITSLEDNARVRVRANALKDCAGIDVSKPDARSLVAKVAVLWDEGEFSDDDIEQVLESYGAVKDPVRNRAGWLFTCLENRATKIGKNFKQMLAVTVPPLMLLHVNGATQ